MKKTKRTTSPEPAPETPAENTQVRLANIVTEMQDSYLDYAMSVIVNRALPDVRDGLKPVHRRILYAMHELGLTSGAKFRKSAAVVGEVLGKYHPHGDVPVYDALVRMAQDFSFRYPLVIGQGNFGSVDGDSPAAMRYTEAKMAPVAMALLTDIEKDTVDFTPNYDNTRKEPSLLPAAFPNLLVNGSIGIAVGMATNIPPHNLREIVNATSYLIDNADATVDDLMEHVGAPDFPTGGLVFNKNAIREAYATGRGGVLTRGVAEIVEGKRNTFDIIITEIPYQVNKMELIIKIAGFVTEKKLEGIRDIRDESDRDGMRIVIELKGDAHPQKVLNYLYKHTDLERTFHFNMLALVDGIQPRTLTLKEILEEFIKSRAIVIERRTKFDLDVAKKRVHILEGLSKALDHIDAIIKTIKKSADREMAHGALMKEFKLSDLQSTAILEMRLQTLAGLERKKIDDELKEKRALVKWLEDLLSSPKKIRAKIKEELSNIGENYGNDRRTRIISGEVESINVEDLIPEEEHLIVLTQGGYVKRMKPQTFKAQRRGGKGILGGPSDEDPVMEFVQANTHDDLLLFTSKGKVYGTKAYEIPESSRTSKGKAIVNFISLSAGETITSLLALPKSAKGKEYSLVMLTERGIIKKTQSALFEGIRRSGIIAINLEKNDTLRWARLMKTGEELMLFTEKGSAIRFRESDVRAMGRTAGGVRAILLRSGDRVMDTAVITKGEKEKKEVFTIAANGYGKRSSISEFKVQRRGGSGIKAMTITPKTGHLVGATIVAGDEEFIALSHSGKAIRTTLSEVPLLGRSTQGVRIMKLDGGDRIASMTAL